MENKEKKVPKDLGFYMPSEWEKQEAIWFTWPKDPITWPDRLVNVQNSYLEIIEIISSFQKVNLLVDDIKAEESVRNMLSLAKIPTKNIYFWHIETQDAWIRDYGPTFLVNENKDELAMIDWTFNAWGNKYEDLKRDTIIPKIINEKLKIKYFYPNIVLEGGSIEVDGEKTVLVTKQCLLNKNRNPLLKYEEIEKILKDYLNVEKVLWLDEGIEGDDTDGHIDDITRFVAPGVVVTAIEEDEADVNYLPLQKNYLNLSQMIDAKNRRLSVIKLPMPKKIWTEDKIALPASYANFLITNEVVLVPIYNQKNDEKALSILKDLFPSKKVLGIFCNSMIFGRGAIHCLSQQQPLIIR